MFASRELKRGNRTDASQRFLDDFQTVTCNAKISVLPTPLTRLRILLLSTQQRVTVTTASHTRREKRGEERNVRQRNAKPRLSATQKRGKGQRGRRPTIAIPTLLLLQSPAAFRSVVSRRRSMLPRLTSIRSSYRASRGAMHLAPLHRPTCRHVFPNPT